LGEKLTGATEHTAVHACFYLDRMAESQRRLGRIQWNYNNGTKQPVPAARNRLQVPHQERVAMRACRLTKRSSRSPSAVLALALGLLGSLVFCPFSFAGGAKGSRLVVVLYPDPDNRTPGCVLVDQGIRSTFPTNSSESIEVHNEYLDVSRFQEAEYQQQLAGFLRRKYASQNVELVIAGLSPTLDFLLKHRKEVFPGIPVVYCVIDQGELKTRTLPSDVIGVPIAMDLTGTLEIALKLQPRTRHVFVIAGKAEFDAKWNEVARQTFRAYEDRVEFVYLSGLPMEDLLNQVEHLPEDSIIYYLHVFEDGTGEPQMAAKVVEALAAKANAPIYGHVDAYVGRGVVGGHVFGFENEGRNAAKLGLRILAGEKPTNITAHETSANTYMFDWRQLQRWGISEQMLPPGSDIRYREVGFWDLYRWHVVGVASLCIIEALLIVGLLVQRSNLVRAHRRFRQIVEAAPNGMVMVAQDGQIVLANSQMEKLFGYPLHELLGQTVEMLVPQRWRSTHGGQRDGFFAKPAVRLMGAGRELFARRRDGSEFPVEIGLSPLRTDAGFFVLASIIDVTQRRQAEEGRRESQRELRALTGKLLQAQETERRRIARELHDDLSQSLALLSIEMDVLGKKPPETAAQHGERMQELSDRVKQLSSSVHELSHQLHPAKLEQLGLVAAVRALSKELTHNSDLQITFTDHQVPTDIPEDTALCLYRIVQEGLRNVVKHSAARHATVDLTGSSEAIHLRIADDGTGFEAGSVDDKGKLGLVSMRERLRVVGGEIAISSIPLGGTGIEVRVPLHAASTESPLPTPSGNIG
jgi:PAS domain S-box-containing protein